MESHEDDISIIITNDENGFDDFGSVTSNEELEMLTDFDEFDRRNAEYVADLLRKIDEELYDDADYGVINKEEKAQWKKKFAHIRVLGRRASVPADEFYEDVVAYTRSSPTQPPSRLSSVQQQKLEIVGKKQVYKIDTMLIRRCSLFPTDPSNEHQFAYHDQEEILAIDVSTPNKSITRSASIESKPKPSTGAELSITGVGFSRRRTTAYEHKKQEQAFRFPPITSSYSQQTTRTRATVKKYREKEDLLP